MDAFEIGSCFKSYNELMEKLNEYCESTNTKFTTKDSRLITNEFATAKESFVYSELKLICVYGRTTKFKEQNRKRKMRTIKIPKTECPAYFRIKLINSGVALQIVAMNTKHNHVCEKIEEPENTKKKKKDKIKKEIKSEDEDDENTAEGMEESEFIEVYIDPDYDTQPEAKFSFKGICVPVFNNFRNDSSLKVGPVPQYAQYLSDHGIKGVIVNGCAGEGMSMTVGERKLVTEEWITATRSLKMHVMVQVGACPLPDVLDLAKHAETSGADSILCIPELYFRPTSIEELAYYLKIVSEAAPKIPLIYSHNPDMTGVHLNMVDFLNNYAANIPTFCGIEFVSTILDDAVAALEASNRKYKIFHASDSQLALAISMGFDAAIAPSGNLYPQQVVTIMKDSKGSKSREARKAQKELNVNCGVISSYGFWVSSMKAAMSFLSPINLGICRAPLKNISDEDLNTMKDELIK